MSFYPLEEPSAGMRGNANAVREQYVAYVQAGFTEAQALELVGRTLAAIASATVRRQGGSQ